MSTITSNKLLNDYNRLCAPFGNNAKEFREEREYVKASKRAFKAAYMQAPCSFEDLKKIGNLHGKVEVIANKIIRKIEKNTQQPVVFQPLSLAVEQTGLSLEQTGLSFSDSRITLEHTDGFEAKKALKAPINVFKHQINAINENATLTPAQKREQKALLRSQIAAIRDQVRDHSPELAESIGKEKVVSWLEKMIKKAGKE